MIDTYFSNSFLIKHAIPPCPLCCLGFLDFSPYQQAYVVVAQTLNPVSIMRPSFNEKYDIWFIGQFLYAKFQIPCVSIALETNVVEDVN